LIDFSLTDEQKALQALAHKFALEEVRPVAWEVDQNPDPDNSYPIELYKKASELGFDKILVPESEGGPGLGLIDLMLVMEELAWGDAGVAITIGTTAFCVAPLALAGTPEQKKKYLVPFMESKTGLALAAPGTEPTGGTEIFCPLEDPKLGGRVYAKKDGNDWVLNGQKCWAASTGKAMTYLFSARNDLTLPNLQSTTAFIVPADAPGLVLGRVEDKMGCRTCRNQELFLENVRVPEGDVIGPVGGALESMFQENPTFPNSSHLYVAATAIGLANAAYEVALDYANDRVVWGKPIRWHDLIARRLVNMRLNIEAMRAFTHKMAWALENASRVEGIGYLSRLGGESAKYYTCNLVNGIVHDAIEIVGVIAYDKNYLLNKLLRDAVVLPLAGQTAEYHQMIINRKL